MREGLILTIPSFTRPSHNTCSFGSQIGFPDGAEAKASVCNVGELGSIPGLGRSPEGHGYPVFLPGKNTPVFLPGKSHGQRSLVGYSPPGSKEWDGTERLHFHFLGSQIPIMVMITLTSRGCHTLKFPFLDIEGHLKGFSASAEKCRLILSSSNN